MYKIKVYTASLVNKKMNNYRNVLQREVHVAALDEVNVLQFLNVPFVSKVTIDVL